MNSREVGYREWNILPHSHSPILSLFVYSPSITKFGPMGCHMKGYKRILDIGCTDVKSCESGLMRRGKYTYSTSYIIWCIIIFVPGYRIWTQMGCQLTVHWETLFTHLWRPNGMPSAYIHSSVLFSPQNIIWWYIVMQVSCHFQSIAKYWYCILFLSKISQDIKNEAWDIIRLHSASDLRPLEYLHF